MDIERLIREVSEDIGVNKNVDAARGGAAASASEVPAKLEHSLLTPDLSAETLLGACAQARGYRIAAMCVPPYYVAAAKQALRGSGVAVCAALGVPNATFSAAARLADARYSLIEGADELDVSINAMAVKSGNIDDAYKDLRDIVMVARGKAIVKAAVELSLFTDAERRDVLRFVKESGAAYVKIQNVLSGKKADVAEISYVKGILGNNVKIKIDGGVKTLDAAMALIAGGADRIGLTATFAIAEAVER
jgi:deoxyribose-phosphate aldolase